MTENQTEKEGKKPSKFKKFLKGLGFGILVAGTAVAAYDHRHQISDLAKRAGKGIKTGANRVSEKIKSL